MSSIISVTTTLENQQQCQEMKDWISGATGSSVLMSSYDDWGAGHAIDGLISDHSVGIFHSEHDKYAWLQLDFSTPVTVKLLSIVMRYDCYADWFNDVGIYVGNKPAIYGQVSRNGKCTYYEGPAQNGETVELACDAPVSGQYLIVQKVDWSYEPMMVNDLSVCGYEGTLSYIHRTSDCKEK